LTFPGSLGCGPGARGWGSKSIGRVIPVPRCGDRLPVQEAAPSGDRPVAPTRIRASAVQGGTVGRPVPWKGGRLMVFEAQALAPGPGTRSTATVRWRSIQAALSGSRGFQASTSGGGYDFFCELSSALIRVHPRPIRFFYSPDPAGPGAGISRWWSWESRR
jgi:hypothetical protein